jgi:hypothetical protein
MHTKLHNCKETTPRERKKLILVRWDSRWSCGSLSYFLQEITHFSQRYKSAVKVTNDIFEVLNYYHYYHYYCYYIFSEAFSSWYFSWTSGDPHRSGFNFQTTVFSVLCVTPSRGVFCRESIVWFPLMVHRFSVLYYYYYYYYYLNLISDASNRSGHSSSNSRVDNA